MSLTSVMSLYSKHVLRWAHSATGDVVDAEDVALETTEVARQLGINPDDDVAEHRMRLIRRLAMLVI